jgi:hypothetical protein
VTEEDTIHYFRVTFKVDHYQLDSVLDMLEGEYAIFADVEELGGKRD